MSTPLSINIPHSVGRAEARRRIQSGFERMIGHIPGSVGTCNEHWDGDRLSFSIASLGQTVRGVVEVHDAAVLMEIELPGILGMLGNRLKAQLHRAGRLLLTKD